MYIFQPDRYLLDRQIKKVGHYISGRVLDVGAGEFDRYSRHFASKEYIKMDIRHKKDVDVVGSIEEIPFPDESFDSAVCTQVFEHLENPEKGAKEISRVLKKGGHLLVTVPQMNELHEEPYDFFRYTNYGVSALFERSGFLVVEISQRGGVFSNIAQIKIRYAIDRFDLYKRPAIGRLLAPFLSLYGRFGIFLDYIDTSTANKKHAIGWCVILQKI